MDDELGEKAGTAALRQLRLLIPPQEDTPGWRDDLRLFAIAWAAGFLFFMVLIG